MANKIYTAQEMRNRANYERIVNGNLIVSAMLCRAVDALEREIAARDAEIAYLSALVKELAGALENEIDKIEPNYDFVDSLVAKAREVCNA